LVRTILQAIEELSKERDRLLAREGAHRATDTDQQRILRIDHDLEVLWDLRRRELAGEAVDLDNDYYDRYTVDPGGDPPPPSSS
jgi:hypothetical protein